VRSEPATGDRGRVGGWAQGRQGAGVVCITTLSHPPDPPSVLNLFHLPNPAHLSGDYYRL